MNVVERRTPEETRARILEAAWDLFRQLGSRATIADVADKLGMSSANVYRFYASKQALCEAVCANQLAGMTAVAAEIATGEGSAGERIREIMLMLHNAMREQMTSESRVHEIVEIAIRDRWPAIDAFHEECAVIAAGLVAEGQARGEFGPGDPGLLGVQTLCACAAIHHPTLIALCMDGAPSPSVEQVVDFALRALSHPGPFPQAVGA
jgi:AcrR family transcriptional regulator